MAGISLNTGLVRLEVTRDGERVGDIRFNPRDVRFIEMFYGLYHVCEEKQEEFSCKAEKLEEADYPGLFQLQKTLMRELEEEIDRVFGCGTSAAVFGETVDLDLVIDFFRSVLPYIQKAREDATQKYAEMGTDTLE